MAVERIKVDQVDINQTGRETAHRLQSLPHTVGIGFGFHLFSDTAAKEHIKDLAYAEHFHALRMQLVEQHSLRRRNRVIVTVGGAFEAFRRAQKRTGNYPAHFQRTAQHVTRDFADAVDLVNVHHAFVRRDLEHAVGRGIDDHRTGAKVFPAQFLHDFRPGSSLVTQGSAPNAALEFRYKISRKAMREKRKRFFQMDAHHLPVTGSGVFAR